MERPKKTEHEKQEIQAAKHREIRMYIWIALILIAGTSLGLISPEEMERALKNALVILLSLING